MGFVKSTRMILATVIAAAMATSVQAADLTIAIGSEPTTLDPQSRDDGGERAINDNIYETLMVRDAMGKLGPGLAVAAPTQIDGTTWEFKLRQGVAFHNGEPFNAEAAAFSVNRIINPDFNSEQGSFFSTITGAKAVDDETLHVMTSGPDPILPTRMYWMKMVPPQHAQSADFDSKPVGTGPYKLASWDRGNSITLAASNDYWGGKPGVGEVQFRFIEESGTRLAGLLAGEVDLTTNLLPEFVPQVPKAAHVSGLELPIIILSAVSGPTQDVRVRQALNYAVDKQALAESLFEGYAKVAEGQLLAPSFFGFNDAVDGYPYDPDKAKALLAEAGAEGVEVELIGTAGRWLKDRELVEVVAAYWEEVGVKANVRIFEFDEYLNRLFDRKNRGDAIFVVSSNELLDADRPFSAYYHLDGIGSSNKDAKLAELIDGARTETDIKKRATMYNEAVQRAFDEAYFVWLLNIEDVYGLSERLDWTPRVDAKLLVKEMQIGG